MIKEESGKTSCLSNSHVDGYYNWEKEYSIVNHRPFSTVRCPECKHVNVLAVSNDGHDFSDGIICQGCGHHFDINIDINI